MLLRDADRSDLSIVELCADAEGTGQPRTLRDGRGLDDRLTPHRGGGTDRDVGHKHVLAVAVGLLKLDVLPVVRVEDEAGAGVVRDHREGGRTTQGVRLLISGDLSVGLDAGGVQNAEQVLGLTVTVEDLIVLGKCQAVQQLVVDGRLKLRLVADDVPVCSLPVGDRADRCLCRLEAEVRLRLQAERIGRGASGSVGAVGGGAVTDGTSVAVAAVFRESQNAEVVDQVRRGGRDREQVADSGGALTTGDSRIELDRAEATGVHRAGEQTAVDVLLLHAHRSHVLGFHLPRLTHGRAA